jgi:hypothetical protein
MDGNVIGAINLYQKDLMEGERMKLEAISSSHCDALLKKAV